MKNLPRLFAIGLIVTYLVVMLDGCGFRLRGSMSSAAPLPAVYLQGVPGSAIMVGLNETLHTLGTVTASDKMNAQYVLNISNEQQTRRILSVSSSGKVQEYELYYSVSFEVTDTAGNILLGNQKVNLVRGFSFDDSDVLAKDTEERYLIEGMRQEAIQGIIRRMQAIKPPVPEEAEK